MLRKANNIAFLTGTGPLRIQKVAILASHQFRCEEHTVNFSSPAGRSPQQNEKGVVTMFKYKSPLSRLLEGAGKTKEEETVEVTADTAAEENQDAQPEPIADFNALRQALAGGNMASETYEEEEVDDLTTDEVMPGFEEDIQDEVSEADDIAQPEIEEPAAQEAPERDDQIVTLHLTPADSVDPDVRMMSAIAHSVAEETEEDDAAEAEVEVAVESVEPEAVAEPEISVVEEEVVSEPEPVMSQPVVEAPAPVEPTPAPATDRSARVKTTFLGFERADTHVQDLMETSEPVAKTETAQQTYPVGWLVVTAGPGRGSSINLSEGLMQIGRNDDQAIQLDFGDTGISRSNHAVIAYDPEDRKCYLGHGGKANLVRLNGKPVLSTVPLSNGDLIRISETSLRFAAFCDDGFDWRDAD